MCSGENSNQNVEIHKNGGVVATFLAPDVLSCGEHRKFWISWQENTIRVKPCTISLRTYPMSS